MLKQKSLLDKIYKKIDNSKVVSFDIFDTLLLRPYIKPIDLFLHLENIHNIYGFQNARIKAEQNARIMHKDKEDITLAQIYEEIDDCYKSFEKIENDWEIQILNQNPEMKQVYDYAKSKNKQIIITSDMYLPTESLIKALNKNGYDGFSNIFVSGELNKTKHSGSIYEYIIKKLNVNPKDILHIGDNKHADYKKAKEYNINAVRYKQVTKSFIKSSIKTKKFYKLCEKNDIGASILISLLSWNWLNEKLKQNNFKNYWNKLGYKYGGPIVYGYTKFIANDALQNKINNILFIARDGYSLQKVFDSFNTGIRTNYVYAPRILNLLYRLDYKSEKDLKYLIDYYSKKDNNLKNLLKNNKDNLETFFNKNKDLFITLSKQEQNNYINYLNKLVNKNDNLACVDSITWKNFTGQKLLVNSLNQKIYGYYWSVIDPHSQNTFNDKRFIENNKEYHQVFTKNWDFLELIMTSPEYPIKNLTNNGTPIYDKNPNQYEIQRKNIYPYINDGIIKFAKTINNIFENKNIFLTSQTLVNYINCLCDYPNKEDLDNMLNIMCSGDTLHSKYIPLFGIRFNFLKFLKAPITNIRYIKRSIWRTKIQTLIICIIYPIKFKMKGIKKLQLTLFPKLKNKYLNISISLMNYKYEFNIGNNEGPK